MSVIKLDWAVDLGSGSCEFYNVDAVAALLTKVGRRHLPFTFKN